MSRVLTALLLLLSAAPARGAPPRTLTLKWFEAWNRHHDFGADGERLRSTVTLDLEPGGRAQATDRGTRKRSQLDRTGGYKEERTAWTQRWRGSWNQTGGRLTLRLRLEGADCDRVIARRGEADKKVACDHVAKVLTMRCDKSKVPVHGAAKGRRPVAAWRCVPEGDATMGSPVPWVFGLRRCLQASRSRGLGRRYTRCE